MVKSFITRKENAEIMSLYEQRVISAQRVNELLRTKAWGSDAERSEYLKQEDAKQDAVQRRIREIFGIA